MRIWASSGECTNIFTGPERIILPRSLMDLHLSQNSTNLEERNYSHGSLFRNTFSERLGYLYYEQSNEKNTRARAKVAFRVETSRARRCSEECTML